MAVSFVVFKFVLLPIRVEGGSMLPTYQDRSVNFVNRLAYLFHEPRRGDVVAIGLLAGEHVMYMKRVVGLPGETVAFHKGHLYINGQASGRALREAAEQLGARTRASRAGPVLCRGRQP